MSDRRHSEEPGVHVQTMICFISDFGLDDAWVGVCHAVIHRACPQAHLVDLAHDIPPFDIRKGAATAAAGVYQIPDAIHLVVVDPGVGDGRRDLCVETVEGAWLVGPDNGVLVPAALRSGGVLSAYSIDPAKIDFRSPLATFHARDILAPAAAALACGVSASSLGERIDSDDLAPAPFGPCIRESDCLVGEVLESDRFGSLRFNIIPDDLAVFGGRPSEVEVTIGHNSIRAPFASTFSDVKEGDPVVLFDSSGWLTLALNRASAEERYGGLDGAAVRICAVR